MDAFTKAGERGLKARSEYEVAAHECEVRELRVRVDDTAF